MMKKKYLKPTQQVIVLPNRTNLLLQGSPTEEKPNSEEYDDYLG